MTSESEPNIRFRRVLLVGFMGAGKSSVGDHLARQLGWRFRDFDHECEIGDELTVDLFADTAFVDVTGISKGKGYQGVVRRHNFSGGRATHGSKFGREAGSTGMAASPSKVHKGTKMPGRMGHERRTIQNLRVLKVDGEKQILLVKGSVPGPKHSTLIVSGAKKKDR